MNTRHKKQNDENFPVAFCLFPRHYKKIINAYYMFARTADDIADNPSLSCDEKIKELDILERILLGEKNLSHDYQCATDLRTILLDNNFDFSVATDLLRAFRQDADGFVYQSWAQLTNYCLYSAAPVGRFLLALYNESPSTYIPAAALCSALQIVNHVQDTRYDYHVLKRVYFPEKILHKYNVSTADLENNFLSEELRNAANDILVRVERLLKDAEILPQIVTSSALRIEIFVIINLTKSMIYKLQHCDFLAQNVKLSKFDWICAATKAFGQALFTKRKATRVTGLIK